MIRRFFQATLLIVITGAQGQDTLSMAGAIGLGLQNNFDIQLEILNKDIASNNRALGKKARYPTVSLSLNQNNAIIQRKPANPFAVPGRNISDNINGQLDVQFVLFDGFAIDIARERLDELERLSGGYVALVVENTVQSIILGYYAVLLERERLNVLHRVMDFSKQQYDYVKLRKELGSAITFDVLNEQNNYLTDSSNVLMQEVAYRNAVRNLNILLNEEIARNYDLTDSLFFEGSNYEYADLDEQMTRSNTNLSNQYINKELARLTTRAARADLYPSLSFNLGANGSLDQLNANFRSQTGNSVTNTVGVDINGNPVTNTVPETALTQQTQRGHSYGLYGNLALRWNLFSGGQLSTAVENAGIGEHMAALTSEQLKRDLENELLLAYDAYNLRQQLVKVAEIKREAADLNLSLANERYRNGSISAIDLRIIQQNFRNAALENFAAIYDAIATRTDLIRLTGGFVQQR